ncbi:VanZ family protein [uncultured Desulfobacter sp.]|uniref:VanZ family protein n=1 Tax=uncultured Desulfobacter sp. TaxID=240139 RepID=UPI0029F54D9F|nr:VanZ family protein [uncultured Desulfobacter sp.]
MKVHFVGFVFLALVTLFCHKWIEQYTAIGPDMLSGQWQVRAQDRYQGMIQNGILSIESQDPLKSISIYQNVAGFKPGMLLRLCADISSEKVTPGLKPWNRARLLLVQNDGKKDRWDFHHSLAVIEGSLKWKRFDDVFTVSLLTEKLQVVAQMSRCTGRFEVKNISLVPVAVNSVYTWTARVVLFIWAVFGLLVMGSFLVRVRDNRALRVLMGLAFAGIIIGTTMPVGLKNQMIKDVKIGAEAVKETVLPLDKQELLWKPDKVGHFCFFALFSCVMTLLMNHESVFCIPVYVIMVAAGTEFAQMFIGGRTASLGDFFIDMAGGALGIMICLISGYLNKNIKKR